MGAGQRPGIRDVARAAGVSVTTVSHALNDAHAGRVAENTRERVRAAAARLGYEPSRIARSLRLQRASVLALVSDHIATTPHAGQIILGVQEAAMERGWTVLMFNTTADATAERRALEAVAEYQADGVLYATMYHRRVRLPRALRHRPTVLLDAVCDDPSIPSVVPDEQTGGRSAVDELIAHGHRRIGFVTNRDDIPATRGRLQGYRDALRSAGIRFDAGLVTPQESVAGGGYLAARALLNKRMRPTALFCFNDRMAMGAYRAAAELGLRVPHDLSVVGFDNQEIVAEGLFPALTTVALPHYQMGRWAVETLLELIDSPTGLRRDYPELMPCPLVRRSSVAAPPA